MVSLASTDRASSGVLAPSIGSSLKRKHIDSGFSSDHEHSSDTKSVKRRRVSFDPDVDVRILPDWNEKTLDLVREEVKRALEKHRAGDYSGTDQLKNLLSTKPTASDAPTTTLLTKYVSVLANHVSSLDHKCASLVHAIIDCHWLARNEVFVRSYRYLLRNLLSVQPGYTSAVLQMLANMFVELPPPALRQQDDPFVPRDVLRRRVHESLRFLLKHIAMLSTHLSPILPATFPFSTDSTKTHVSYIKNLLKLTEYCPEIKGEIMALITDKLVKIDAQIQVDMDELEDDIEDHLTDEKAEDDAEDEEGDISDDESVSSEESISEEERRLKELKESVAKLDAMMDILFEYYHPIFAKGDMYEMEETFESLLSHFANIILPTYHSRHTQFLLFHFGQSNPALIEHFAGACSHLAFDPQRPAVLRVAAAAYLASFIARGAHVSSQTVRDVFDLLCHQLDALRVQHETGCKGPDLRRYGTYYAIAQALLYTFCFRWRDLILTEDDEPASDDIIYEAQDPSWSQGIQETLRRNIYSKLNPLRICSPAIVNQFARIAHHVRFMYVFPLIETNKRVRLSRALASSGYLDGIAVRETALSAKKGEESFQLDAYFPFDPYCLPKSKRWLEGDYVEWRPIPGLDGAGGAEQEEDDEEEDSSDEESESESLMDEAEHLDVLDEETGTEASSS